MTNKIYILSYKTFFCLFYGMSKIFMIPFQRVSSLSAQYLIYFESNR